MKQNRRACHVTVAFAVTIVVALLVVSGAALAATFTVSSITDAFDVNPGNGICATAGGVCTLRAAIQEANATPAADTIILIAGTYTLSLVGANEDLAATGDLDATSPIGIVGAGEAITVIDATGLGDRVFETLAAAVLNITGVTIRGGNVAGNGGGILAGGGTTVTLTNVIVAANTASVEGGGVDNSGTLTLTDSTIRNNTAGSGGGLNNGAAATVTMNRATVSGNTDTGINNSGILNLTNVTISNNTTVGGGGGINNKAGASVTMQNVTIAFNTAGVGRGGGIENVGQASAQTSIFSSNTPLNCLPNIPSVGQNLESANDCAFDPVLLGDIINTDPQLLPLANYGSPTQTHALAAASPAIDSADAVNCAATDQRLVVRPQDGDGNRISRCDRGAFEFTKDKIGVFRAGRWFLDYSGNLAWNGCFADTCVTFGLSADRPVTGDWAGLGRTTVGVFRKGQWYLDYSGNGIWEGPVVDRQFGFGLATDIPVTGDWNGDGKTKVGVFRFGQWFLDFNGNNAWNGPAFDRQFRFGLPSAVPVTGDWNGDGRTKIWVFRGGIFEGSDDTWYLDFNGNGIWEGPVVDRQFIFGLALVEEVPVTGDWNGDGRTKVGIFRRFSRTWILDFNGSGVWDGPVVDKFNTFGLATDFPVTGNW